MRIRPITFRAAAAFVAEHHRHNKPPRGMKFAISVVDDDGVVRGVAMVGRPVARHEQERGFTVEVNRTCVVDTPNANSMLYGAAWRVAKAMGYDRMITYTQADESGASLRAAGFVRVRKIEARRSWAESTADDRLRAMRDPVGNGGVARVLWEIKSKDCFAEY
jgi:hypothetical protein